MTSYDRAYRTYKNVKLYRVQQVIPGTDFKILSNGRTVPTTPKYAVFYRWADGALCDTLKELKQDVDDFFSVCAWQGIDRETAVRTLNTGERKGEK